MIHILMITGLTSRTHTQCLPMHYLTHHNSPTSTITPILVSLRSEIQVISDFVKSDMLRQMESIQRSSKVTNDPTVITGIGYQTRNLIIVREVPVVPNPSRKSGSRISSLRTQTTEPYCDSREYLSLESDITPNGCGIEWDHALPSSGYSFNQNRSTKIKKFRKNLWGVYIVAERFDACDENEVSVKAGDHVSVWNQDDPEWYWIVKHDTSEEGFVPSYHLKEIVNSESHRQQGSLELRLILIIIL